VALKVAVIGAGWGAGLHADAFSSGSDAEVVAVCSRTRSHAEEFARRLGIPSVYTDFDEMAESQELDVISIATPPSSHCHYTVAAADRGYHVLCDKPAAATAADAEEMVHAVEGADVRHATGFISRSIPELRKLHGLLAEGTIGDVREIHARCALGIPVLPMTWLYDAEAGGGALLQHGQHMIEIVRWVFGGELVAVCGELTYDVTETVVGPQFHNVFDAFGWAAMRLKAGGGEELPRAPVTADTGYAFAAKLSTGARAYFWEAWHEASLYSDQIEVFGTAGTLVWRAGTGLTLVRGREPPQQIEVEGASPSGADLRDVAEQGKRHWRELVDAFTQDILGRDHAPYATLHDAFRVQQVCDAVQAATASRTWEPVGSNEVPPPDRPAAAAATRDR
jgi:predicted dehydrogenase